MYDVTKQIISRNDPSFKILSVAKIKKNNNLGLFSYRKTITQKPLLVLKKAFSITNQRHKNNILQHNQYFSKMYISK